MAGPAVCRTLRWLERVFFLAGIAGLACVYLVWRESVSYQVRAKAELRDMIAAQAQALDGGRPDFTTHPADALLGELVIPRLALSVPILEGDDPGILRIASGHLPGTPLPWDHGNAVIAGHRETLFRPLKDIRVGEELQVVTARADLRYRVRQILVVDPNALWVLAPWPSVDLTLLTCYPFHYLGPAPRRFVVQAERTEVQLR
jgi:sortase A